MTHSTPRHLSPSDDHREDTTSHYVTGEPKEDTEKDKEENKSAGMREKEELPTSPVLKGAKTTPMNYFSPWYRKLAVWEKKTLNIMSKSVSEEKNESDDVDEIDKK